MSAGPASPAFERVLPGAAERVRTAVRRIQGSKKRAEVVGVGASGDKTLVADREAERILIGALSKVKGMRFLSEEAGEQGAPSAPLTAVIDPVDGSSNFERGIPYYCTSVAVARGRRLEDVCYALVEDLVSGDVYVGRSGSGATKNGAPARTSGRRELRSSVIAVDGSRVPRGELGRLAPLSAGARRVLHFGANALEICMVADGRLDAFVDLRGKLRVTDVAAALLVAEEAGAKATALRCDAGESGMSLAGRYSVVVASSEELHDEIVGSVGGLGRLP